MNDLPTRCHSQPGPPPSRRLALRQWIIAIALLLAMFFQLSRGALRNSITFDEGQHITRGYVYLTTGDLRLQRFRSAHPPGMAMLEAAPLLLDPGLPDPATLGGWKKADTLRLAKQIVWDSPNIERLLFAARVPVMLVTLLLAAFVFRWAQEASRSGIASLIALGLCTFDPNIIAHGMLATTDAGVTTLSFIALYWLWRGLRRPSRRNIIIAGITLGLALLTKMTAALLLPVAALLVLVVEIVPCQSNLGFFGQEFLPQRTQRAQGKSLGALGGFGSCSARLGNKATRQQGRLRRLWGLAVQLAALGLIAFVVVWGAYGFEIGALPGLPWPVPAATHLSSVMRAQEHLETGHINFFMGQVSERGWWNYFPVAFLIKTPLPLLILLIPAAARLWRNHHSRCEMLPLLIFIGAYSLVALLSSVNIGYRHLLPILPALLVLASQAVSFQLSAFSFRLSRITHHVSLSTFYLLLSTWYIISTLCLFPNYLTFFNELVGGPKNGYKYLVDSNLDWGQALVELRTYIARNHLGKIDLSATGYVNPASYGIDYDPLPPMPNPQPITRLNPEPGRYYIGAHNLQIGSPLDHDVFGWFREREPDEWIANAILVYDAPQRPAGQWVAQCAPPHFSFEPERIAQEFGRSDLRVVYFDCSKSWIYPASAPGWYLIGDDANAKTPAGLAREFRAGELSNEPRFTLYRLEAAPELNISRQARIALAEQDTMGVAVQTPVSVGPLALLGFTLDRAQVQPGQTVTLSTYWQVTSGVNRLVSLLAHVVQADGQVIAGGDGLGVSIENWQPGDIIVQHHALAIPPNTPPGIYQTQTGLYALDTGERFEATSGSAAGDRILLAALEVKP